MSVDLNQPRKLKTLFQRLADANRLRIINYIGDQERSVNEIVQATGLSQPLVSHHLKSLREGQILETHRNGPFIYHRLKDPRLLDALGLFSEIASSLSEVEWAKPMFHCPPMWKKRFR
ncbi:MAG: winged helix-turn-helix transcriptional regulator [Fidelibacterota bacterium]|nr:MAG: winged helix-turn-helix transcriptional regulator [Candidatus Neomarinimicrobiota bacterium]